jgi:universal stress protein A
MANYKHILIAVDFTPETMEITRRGRGLAQQNGAKVSLVHVVEMDVPVYPSDLPLPGELDFSKRLIEHAEVSLKELAITHGLRDAKRYVDSGSAKSMIVKLAEDIEADLIVLGSHGRHGLQLLLGDTANGVLHRAPCDVLAVRIGARTA